MAERIHRHFQRMHATDAAHVQINWPTEPFRAVPGKIKTVFSGDTLHAFAWFSEKPLGEVGLDVKLADGRIIPHIAQLKDCPDYSVGSKVPDPEKATSLARMATARLLDTFESKAKATNLAVRYQLVSENTNCIVIDVRAIGEKAEDLPELRKVRHVMAAGWGGMGSVDKMSQRMAHININADMSPRASLPPNYSRSMLREELHAYPIEGQSAGHFNSQIVAVLNDSSITIPTTLAELASLRFDPDVLEALEELVSNGFDEQSVVAAFLDMFASSGSGDGLERNARRKIRMAFKAAKPADYVLEAVGDIFAAL